MKILVYSSYVPDLTDGVSRSAKRLVSGLEQKGIDVTVCTTDNGWRAEEIARHKTEKLRIFKSLPSRNADFSPGLFMYLKKNMRKFDIVQLYGTYNFPTVFGAHIAKAENIPYIICPAGNMIPSASTRKIVRNVVLKNIFFNLMAKSALDNASRIICTSVQEKETIQGRIANQDIACIKNGIDHSIYNSNVSRAIIKEKLGIPEDKKFLLFLGRLSYEKRIPFLLDAWEEVAKKMSGIILVVAGGGCERYKAKLARHIKRLKCRQNIVMAGEVTGDLKIALLRYSQCLLLPSFFESFGIVVLESLVSGKPVIASTDTPWSILEEERFGRWLPHDLHAWANAIREVSFNGTYQSNEFSKRSRKWVIENYDWQDVAQRYVDVYEQILRRN